MDSLKISYSGILFKCPLDNEKSDCPFIEIRMVSPKNRVEYYIEMNESEFNKAIGFHERCLCENRNKTSKIVFTP